MLSFKAKQYMVNCHFSKTKQRRPGICETCDRRFVCLTTRWTEEDRELYKEIPMFLMNLPNTEEGRDFYSLLKKYLNKDRFQLDRKGRAKNRAAKGGTQYSTPIVNCDYFSVYLRDSDVLVAQGRRIRDDNAEEM